MPARILVCPAGCGWSASTFLELHEIEWPEKCPRCGCPIWNFGDELQPNEASKMAKWKVYHFNDSSRSVIVEWPGYEPTAIKDEAIKNSDVFDLGDYPELRVRSHGEE